MEVESNTFIHDFGFPVHYFSPDELPALFDSLLVTDCYTRLKHDFYPVPHVHETHVLIGLQNTVHSTRDKSAELLMVGRNVTFDVET